VGTPIQCGLVGAAILISGSDSLFPSANDLVFFLPLFFGQTGAGGEVIDSIVNYPHHRIERTEREVLLRLPEETAGDIQVIEIRSRDSLSYRMTPHQGIGAMDQGRILLPPSRGG
jgi:hypothetical protein